MIGRAHEQRDMIYEQRDMVNEQRDMVNEQRDMVNEQRDMINEKRDIRICTGEQKTASSSRRDVIGGILCASTLDISPLSLSHRTGNAYASSPPYGGEIPSCRIPLPYAPASSDGATLELSQVIKGCWQLSGGHKGDPKSDRTSGPDAVKDIEAFVSNGITTLDTADIYGPSEMLIGEFRRTCPDLANKSQVLTKLCCFGNMMSDAQRNPTSFVRSRIQKSASRLGYDGLPLDCVQFFWEDYGVPGYLQTVQALAEAAGDGLIRAVGVTNFDTERMRQMTDAGVSISLNQVQYSVLDTRPERYMTQFCLDHGIGIVAFGTVAGGFLSNKYVNKSPSDVRLNTYSLQKYASIIRERGGWEWYQSLLQLLDRLAGRYGVGIAEISTRYILQQDSVSAVIIGARNAQHIDQHKNLFSFSLTPEDMMEIEDFLATGTRPQSDVYEWERGLRGW